MTNDELKNAIENAIGASPALPPAAVRLEAGRRALVRRRMMGSVAASALTLVVGGAAYGLATSSDQSPVTTEYDFAGQTTPSSAAHPSGGEPSSVPSLDDEPGDGLPSGIPHGEEPSVPWLEGQPSDGRAVWGSEGAWRNYETGVVEVQPGWQIADRVRRPLGPSTVAVDVTDGSTHQWFVFGQPGSVYVDSKPDPRDPRTPNADLDFRTWVDGIATGVADNADRDLGRQ